MGKVNYVQEFDKDDSNSPQTISFDELFKIDLHDPNNERMQELEAELAEHKQRTSELEAALQEAAAGAIVPVVGGWQYDHKFLLTLHGLTAIDKINDEDWRNIGHVLGRIKKSLQWWIGDWANMQITDSMKNKEKHRVYFDIADNFDFEPKYVRDCALVCRKIQSSLRNDELDWSHHRVISKLDFEDQIKAIRYAIAENKSVRELRQWIQLELLGNTRPTPLLSTGDPVELKTAFQRTFKAFTSGRVGEIMREDVEELREWLDRIEEGLE